MLAGEVVESQVPDLADEKSRGKNQVCNSKVLFLSFQVDVTPVLTSLTGTAVFLGFSESFPCLDIQGIILEQDFDIVF